MNRMMKNLILMLSLSAHCFAATNVVALKADDVVSSVTTAGNDFARQLLVTIQKLEYKTAVGMTVYIPGLEKDACVSWGFAGAGDTTLPLDTAVVELKSTDRVSYKKSTITAAATSIGADLLRENLLERVKGLNESIYNLLTEKKELSPLHIFLIKLALLVKDHLSDREFFNTELRRLLQRVLVTPEIKEFKSWHHVKTLVDSSLLQLIDGVLPGLLNYIESCWDLVMSDDATFDVEKYVTEEIWFCFKSDDAAQKFLERGSKVKTKDDLIAASKIVKNPYTYAAYEHKIIPAFIVADKKNQIAQAGSVYKIVNPQSKTTVHDFEAALGWKTVDTSSEAQHLFESDTVPCVGAIIHDRFGNAWVGFAVKNLELHEAGMLASALVARTYRKFTLLKRKLNAQNKELAAEKATQHHRNVVLVGVDADKFATTSVGTVLEQELTSALERAISRIEHNYKQTKHFDAHEKQKLAALKEEVTKLKAFIAAAREIGRTDEDLSHDLATVATYESEIEELQSRADYSVVIDESTLADQKAQLDELYLERNILRNAGREVPTKLNAIIVELETALKEASNYSKKIDTIPAQLIIDLAEKLMSIYHDAAEKAAEAAESLDSETQKLAYAYAKSKKAKATSIQRKIDIIKQLKALENKAFHELELKDILISFIFSHLMREVKIDNAARDITTDTDEQEKAIYEFCDSDDFMELRSEMKHALKTIIAATHSNKESLQVASRLTYFIAPEISMLFSLVVVQ